MPTYKYCIVPKCINTSTVTPNKQYFQVPRNAKIRTKWCQAMKRNDKTPLSYKSALYCCEDHFDFETDLMDNIKFQTKGGPRKLKKGVIPHKFTCQKNDKELILVELSAYKKLKQIQSFERVLNTKICHANLLEVPIEFIKCEPTNSKDSTERDTIEADNMPGNETNGPSTSVVI